MSRSSSSPSNPASSNPASPSGVPEDIEAQDTPKAKLAELSLLVDSFCGFYESKFIKATDQASFETRVHNPIDGIDVLTQKLPGKVKEDVSEIIAVLQSLDVNVSELKNLKDKLLTKIAAYPAGENNAVIAFKHYAEIHTLLKKLQNEILRSRAEVRKAITPESQEDENFFAGLKALGPTSPVHTGLAEAFSIVSRVYLSDDEDRKALGKAGSGAFQKEMLIGLDQLKVYCGLGYLAVISM